MSKSSSNTYRGLYTDDDSGIGFDYDYASSSDLNSSTQSQSRVRPFPIPGLTGIRKFEATPLIRFPSDGIIERIRPVTMKNSENSDFIICQTNCGPYVAYRTPVVPAWVTKLVHDIELLQR